MNAISGDALQMIALKLPDIDRIALGFTCKRFYTILRERILLPARLVKCDWKKRVAMLEKRRSVVHAEWLPFKITCLAVYCVGMYYLGNRLLIPPAEVFNDAVRQFINKMFFYGENLSLENISGIEQGPRFAMDIIWSAFSLLVNELHRHQIRLGESSISQANFLLKISNNRKLLAKRDSIAKNLSKVSRNFAFLEVCLMFTGSLFSALVIDDSTSVHYGFHNVNWIYKGQNFTATISGKELTGWLAEKTLSHKHAELHLISIVAIPLIFLLGTILRRYR